METWQKLALAVGVWLGLTWLLTWLIRWLVAREHPLRATARGFRNLLLPIVLWWSLWLALGWSREGAGYRLLETVLWMAVILLALSLVRNTAFTQKEGGRYAPRVPKLFLDILRLILVVVGAVIVFSGVWGADVSALVTALGVSSIVLGLALQNTLDNVMAGISVLFERPFEVGDWIKVGDSVGQVVEMNWRSVRVRTRSLDLVVLPNSLVGREKLVNYSSPTRIHGENLIIGFSYDDAPNKVKRILHQVAMTTRGVIAQPPIHLRTKEYAAYSIEYEVRFFIEDYERQPEIVEEFMTKVWYAAKRNGLTIPFPIQTNLNYHARMPQPRAKARTREALGKVPVFVPLEPDELEALSRDAVRFEYGRGERVVHQGDVGDALYLIHDGTAVVSVRDERGGEREVARLSRGEFFGEMAMLTGEPRSASVTAVDDLSVLVVYKDTLHDMLERRPALAQEMAEIMEARRLGLRTVQEMQIAPPEQRARIESGAADLVKRIRHFFGL